LCFLAFAPAIAALGGEDRSDIHVQVADVELAPGGVLQGRLLPSDATVLPSQEVVLHDATGRIAVARMDHQGQFVFGPVTGGVYQLVVGEEVWVIRTWASGTAPPSAVRQLTLDHRAAVVRGQYHAPPFLNSMARCIKYGATKPLVVGSVLAVAVGVPVIIHNIDQDDQS
jgi:hypothetical protein